MVRTVIPKSNRKIGMEFEEEVDNLLNEQGYDTCTPRKTALIVFKSNVARSLAFLMHKDFFGIFDGCARVPRVEWDFKTPKIIWWQCKRNWLKLKNTPEGRDILAGILAFKTMYSEEKRIYYLDELGETIYDVIP
jgi:hypothetical protein